MLGNHGIQPITLVFTNTKNCFIHLPSNLVTQLSLHENQALELSWDHYSSVFLSWTKSRSPDNQEDNKAELSRHLGEKLGLRDGEQGFLRPCTQVLSVQQVLVEPLTADDWEILELHAAVLEKQLLDQIRMVFPDAVFPVWVDQRTVIYIKIVSLSPTVPYGRLEQFTELNVSPKIRAGNKDLFSAPLQTTLPTLNQPLHKQPDVDRAPSSKSSLESSIQEAGLPVEQHYRIHQHWRGIADLKSLVRYMLTGNRDPVKETPSIPTVPPLLPDSAFRVCRGWPMSPDPLCGPHGVVHIQPRGRLTEGHLTEGHLTEGHLSGSRTAVTYGVLSKMLSPKEARESAKLAMEEKKKKKKKSGGAHQPSGGGAGDREEEEGEGTVVKVVCHHPEKLNGKPESSRQGEVHGGSIWIPQSLRAGLHIDIHSSVRIKPIKSTPKVATSIHLQPLQQLPEAETEEQIQMAFLGWLHSQSHDPLGCLTGHSNTILMPATEGMWEFALTVLKSEPEAKRKSSDQLFLLTPCVIHKTDIQVVREPVNMSTVRVMGDTLIKDLPLLCSLGGVEELSRTGFDFLSHSLMGRPLSRELVTPSRGLRGGALFITGAKGSGKTALSRALCRKAMEDLDAHVEVVDCKKLKGKRAETVRQMLEEVFEQAVWKQPSVVLLDDLDHVTGAPTSPEHEHGPESLLRQHIAQSLKDLVCDVVLRSSLVCLVVSGVSERSLHPSLREVQGSHFIQGYIHIHPPDQVQRAEILRCLILRKSGASPENMLSLDLGLVAKETEGFLPRDLALLLERAIHANALHRPHSTQGLCLSGRDFGQALKGFTPPSLWGAQLQCPSGPGLQRVGGLHHVRQLLMDTILLPAKYPVLFASLPIRQRSGILLYGAPGTGKTLMAGAVAKESGLNFISIKGPELLSKYIGASEQAVRDVFQRAQAAKPCILFFDEFDSLAPRRGHDNTGVTDRVVNQLLTQLDGVEGLQGVYVLAATSRPDLIDPALLRPGRLDKSLYCPPPDQEARVEILRVLTHSVPLAADVDLEEIGAATDMFTGADLKALLYNAQLEVIHNILGPGLLHDPGSGSDSDVSLSSMVLLNHSSGSDDSTGEADGEVGSVLDPSTAPLDSNDGPPEDPRGNLWRLYFGSSFESELENPSSSGQNSQAASGPNSNELTSASARDPGFSHTLAYMSSLQDGYEELSSEQLERLHMDISDIKSNYRRVTEESVLAQVGPSRPGVLLSQAHLTSALANTRASLSKQDWRRFTDLYESFEALGEGKPQRSLMFKPGQKVTFA
ncbi:peroxisome biogenesis factor 1 [Esox lucius]|uniref:Peroxisomal ATPase PEX1 n=1 Tax=Esox lucius TaxID=8010 RepID=A0A6Q2ZNT5_ESOLU|nr:peroxisome biogenesis factor 1 [Esox lucius]